MVDKSNKILKELSIKLDRVYKDHIERIRKEIEKKIKSLMSCRNGFKIDVRVIIIEKQ
ncbi:hypothetical protein [Clostridium botulinum]|uniref:hypothetical protein n=1 Tax=Clostridium botulinum TaxID=1491 RepID=UPI00330B7212|nr:hypothetical protein [Clostridium botulinum]